MAKQLAVSTQLKNANAKILEQLHQVLDAAPNSVARESEGENSWGRVKRSPVTRMAAWLAGAMYKGEIND